MMFLIIVSNVMSLILIVYVLYKKAKIFRAEKNSHLVHLGIIDNPSEILAILQTAKRQKRRLKIGLNDRKISFASLLLKTGPETLFIDSLFPSEGNLLIQNSRFIVVEFLIEQESQNVPLVFRSSCIRRLNYKKFEAVEITFPEKIRKDQKRNYYRINIPAGDDVYVIFNDGDDCIRERVANISGGGLGFYSNRPDSFYSRGRKFESVCVNFSVEDIIVSFAIVYSTRDAEHPVIIDGEPLYFYYGVEFDEIDPDIRDCIVCYVVEKEREVLRNYNRLA